MMMIIIYDNYYNDNNNGNNSSNISSSSSLFLILLLLLLLLSFLILLFLMLLLSLLILLFLLLSLSLSILLFLLLSLSKGTAGKGSCSPLRPAPRFVAWSSIIHISSPSPPFMGNQNDCHLTNESLNVDRLAGLMVKASASRAEDPEFEFRLRRDFSRLSHTTDLKIGTPVATLPVAWD